MPGTGSGCSARSASGRAGCGGRAAQLRRTVVRGGSRAGRRRSRGDLGSVEQRPAADEGWIVNSYRVEQTSSPLEARALALTCWPSAYLRQVASSTPRSSAPSCRRTGRGYRSRSARPATSALADHCRWRRRVGPRVFRGRRPSGSGSRPWSSHAVVAPVVVDRLPPGLRRALVDSAERAVAVVVVGAGLAVGDVPGRALLRRARHSRGPRLGDLIAPLLLADLAVLQQYAGGGGAQERPSPIAEQMVEPLIDRCKKPGWTP